ncbi:hypothetical protein [Salinicoccus roseus]|uniref:hypothetical protein n=1 Tax=Salinicoccus roseus TaxID=45670 RepID=UPI002301CD42|nr:hypothetical protein [Salinicoccus roseus]
MKQFWYGLVLFLFLALPPVRHLLESIMAFHMHMQMPLLFVSGLLMAPCFMKRFRQFFGKWNGSGLPGVILFLIIVMYWMVPKAMDESLEIMAVEAFKFISLPFLAGVPLRDSWSKIGKATESILLLVLAILFSIMAYLYIFFESTLCNNYLLVDQKTVGWGFAFFSLCLILYLVLTLFTDQSQYYDEAST